MDCRIRDIINRVFLCRKNYTVEKKRPEVDEMHFDSEISCSRAEKLKEDSKEAIEGSSRSESKSGYLKSKRVLSGRSKIRNSKESLQHSKEIKRRNQSLLSRSSHNERKDSHDIQSIQSFKQSHEFVDEEHLSDKVSPDLSRTKSLEKQSSKEIFLTPRSAKIRIARSSREAMSKSNNSNTSLVSDTVKLEEISNIKNFKQVQLNEESEQSLLDENSDLNKLKKDRWLHSQQNLEKTVSVEDESEKKFDSKELMKSFHSKSNWDRKNLYRKQSYIETSKDHNCLTEEEKHGNLSKFTEKLEMKFNSKSMRESRDSNSKEEGNSQLSDNDLPNENIQIQKDSTKHSISNGNSIENALHTQNRKSKNEESEPLIDKIENESISESLTEIIEEFVEKEKQIKEDSLETFILKEVAESETVEDEETEVSCSVNFLDKKSFNKSLSKKLFELLKKKIKKNNKAGKA